MKDPLDDAAAASLDTVQPTGAREKTEFPNPASAASADMGIGVLPEDMPEGHEFIALPWLLQASGTYEWRLMLPVIPVPFPTPTPIPTLPADSEWQGRAAGVAEAGALVPWFAREALHLDVDGRYPLMVASGTLHGGLATRAHWIASLARTGSGTYHGSIWYRDGDTTVFPYTSVTIRVVRSFFQSQRRAIVTFSGSGVTDRVRTYAWTSPYHHSVSFEYDTVEGTTAVTEFDTGSHPNRPSSLAAEKLSIASVYGRAGFKVSTTGGDEVIPLSAAGSDALWSDMEMHDAMQVYWSHFADVPQWSVWTLFAHQHEPVPSQGITPTNLGGIMFDDIGPNHRQGTAVFNGSFIDQPPPGDPAPDAAVRRIKFWTACHELGHTFNLAHSWQKSHPPSWGTPWIPLANEDEARSFMNYPYNVAGGEAAFYADFEYRFSDSELLFLRHAPMRFVQHGNADWFEDHGFRQANVLPRPSLKLELRYHRSIPYFEFMEPVTLELKLTNLTTDPKLVNDAVLDPENMTVIVKKHGRPARQWAPFARYCTKGAKKVLNAAESLYATMFVGAGLNGWEISEPGNYLVQIAVTIDGEDVVSNELRLRIAPPQGYDEEFIAQDFFCNEVARTLAFHGSRYFEKANDTLRDVAQKLPERRVAHHAHLALGNPMVRKYKYLNLDGAEKAFTVHSAAPQEGKRELDAALLSDPAKAADTVGHIEYRWFASLYSHVALQADQPKQAEKGLTIARKTLAARGVLASVIQALDVERAELKQAAAG